MDIYGDGSEADRLRGAIDEAGLAGVVTLRGHDPAARESLWNASAFLMTSTSEGYPLSTLESMSHGCPVVSYDIKYGPREQIDDGVNGFLVPAGDKTGAADRLTQMLSSPQLVARMSEAARQRAAEHGKDRFVADWLGVLDSVLARRASRTRIDSFLAEVELLRLNRRAASHLLPWRRASRGREAQLQLRVRALVTGGSALADIDDARFELTAIHRATGSQVDIPISWERTSTQQLEFVVHADVALAELKTAGCASGDYRLRLRFLWENSARQKFLAHDGSSSGLASDKSGRALLSLAAPGDPIATVGSHETLAVTDSTSANC
jgi:poly(glycerol-phosphate) alpha-glucosyltransferase